MVRWATQAIFTVRLSLTAISEEQEKFWKFLWESRDIHDPCPKCKGTGIYLYPSTATWRGGIGGCAMTSDVCNYCWGSGDKFEHGCNLKKYRDTLDAEVHRRSLTVLADLVGCFTGPGSLGMAAAVLANDLEALARKRGKPQFYGNLCSVIIGYLRKRGDGT